MKSYAETIVCILFILFIGWSLGFTQNRLATRDTVIQQMQTEFEHYKNLNLYSPEIFNAEIEGCIKLLKGVVV